LGLILDIVIAVTGASGSLYASRLLEHLGTHKDVSIHLIISEAAKGIISTETGIGPDELERFCEHIYSNDQMEASISSGSVVFDAMIIIPASMNTIAKIAVGISDNLITRLGSVALKERRPLIIVPREAPLSSIHLENLLKLSRDGVIVLPASPGFYNNPEKITDLVDSICSRALDLLGIDNEAAPRYSGE